MWRGIEKNECLPDRWNGVKTNYELFDGFRELQSDWMKGLYIAGVATAFAIPLLFELMQYNNVKAAVKEAQLAIDSGEHPHLCRKEAPEHDVRNPAHEQHHSEHRTANFSEEVLARRSAEHATNVSR